MSKVLRFENSDFGMEPFEFGRYVMHEDCAAIEAERDKLAEDYAALKDERDRLAAESAAYKSFFDAMWECHQGCIDGYDIESAAEECGLVHLAMVENEDEEIIVVNDTPATDSYLAEVRAQAVEEFAKYITTIAGTSILRDCGGYKNTPYKLAYAAKKSAIIYADKIRAAAKGEGVSDE